MAGRRKKKTRPHIDGLGRETALMFENEYCRDAGWEQILAVVVQAG